jgi:diphthamide biosynthesis protein 2
MTENTTFAASGEEAISRQIAVETDVLPQDLSQEEFEDYFEIERTVNEVVKHDYKRVGTIVHFGHPVENSHGF